MRGKIKAVLLAVVLLISSFPVSAFAANPFLPLWERVPDGEPRVFVEPETGKERLYVYGSHDSRVSGYCGPDHVVWSAPVEDPNQWRYEGEAFHVDQLNGMNYVDRDGVTKQLIVDVDANLRVMLYAPDVVYHPENKKYYMYVFVDGMWHTNPDPPSPLNRRRHPMFVLTSDHPAGPFGNPKFVTLAFDPAVLVDDVKNEDGKSRVYLYWTPEETRNLYACELDPDDMATILPGTTHAPFGMAEQAPLNTMPDWNAPFYMFEGSSIRKVNDTYLLAYCRAVRTSQTATTNISEIGWAYSDNPYGDPALGSPWTFGGVVVDNRGERIANPYETGETYTFTGGNVHGGMVKVNGQWYQVYHRDTNISSKRQAMAEPFDLRFEDGVPVIDQVEMTSQGFETDGLNPFQEQYAGYACYLYPASGSTAPNFYSQPSVYNFDPDAERADWYPVQNIRHRSWVGYKYFDFGDGIDAGKLTLVLSVKESRAGTVNVYASDPKQKFSDPEQPKTLIGTIALTGSNGEEHTVEGVVQNLTGKKGIYLEFLNATGNTTQEICQLNKLQFAIDTSLADVTFKVEPEAAAADTVIALQSADGVAQTPVGGFSYAVPAGTYYFVARSPLYVTQLGAVEVGEAAAVSKTITFSELPSSALTLRGVGTDHANGPNSSNRDMEVEGSGYVGWIRNPAWIKFGNTNLLGGIETASLNWARSGSGAATFHLLVAPSGSTGIDQATQIGSFTTSNANTGGWGNANFTNSGEAVFNPVAAHSGGVQDLYVRFQAGEINFGRLVLTLKPQPAGVKNYDITFSVRPYDAAVVVSKLDGTAIAPKEEGGRTFSVEEGFYRYTVSKEGYETETVVLPVTLSERKMVVLKPVGASYTRYEAENGLITNGAVLENAGFSQGQGAGGFTAYAALSGINATFTNTGSVRIAVERETTGIAEIVLAYNSSVTADNQDSVAVKANDSTTVRAWLNASGTTSLFVDLRGGTNYIYVSSPTNPRASNGGNAWIDYDYIDVLDATIPGSVDPAEADEPYSQPNNPIIKSIFTADPEAHVWPTNPNKLYLYPSHDRYPASGCDFMDQYHVYSTENMIDWVDEGEILRSSDLAWQTRPAPNANGMERSFMWAPDCAYNEETGYYYFYFPAPTNTANWGSTWQTGVYRSKYPDRDFAPIPPEETYTKETYGVDWSGYIYGAGDNFVHADGSRNGTGIIDPAVRIFDGQAYLYIGGSQQHYEAKLMDDMVTIVPGSWTRIDNSITPAYHEGPSVFQKDDLYYLIYPGGSDASTGFAGDKFNYCTGPTPMGPWEYKGAFFNPTGCDTSHGSVVAFKEKWYWVYHTQDLSKSGTLRSVCIDELEFMPDGSIVRRSKSFDGPAQNGPDYTRPEPNQTVSMGDVVLGGSAVLSADASAGYDHKVITGFNVAGSAVTLNNIDGGGNGGNRAMLVFHYATPDDLPRLQLHINGKEYNHINFPKTGGRSFFSEITWTTQKLNPGPVNTIRLTSAQDSGGRGKLNLAYVEVILFNDNVPPPGMSGLLTDISTDAAYGARYISAEGVEEGRTLLIAQYAADGRLISIVKAPQDSPDVLSVSRDEAAASAKAFVWDADYVPQEKALTLK
ncbi:MAG: family 43 glycosylhydrolase [Oscillospiraceae bacterium]|nr:family 43 glycosylhydrolase [Oscillospiraceae bacterium]